MVEEHLVEEKVVVSWVIYIGTDIFTVKEKTSLAAKVKAAKQFREKYTLPESIPTTDIVHECFSRREYVPTIDSNTIVEYLTKKARVN